MGLIEDAKRLAGAEPVIHNKMTSENECGMCVGVAGDHAPDCPWLALPRIVRALEAAQRLVDANDGSEPIWMNRWEESGFWFCDDTEDGGHGPDCPWLALQAAMQGARD